jgi:Arc/MetJ-type ribon-helix-helix transcriptional regulator
MNTSQIQITLTGNLSEFVVSQAAAGSYPTPDEYVASLVAEERRRKAKTELEEQLILGLNSGPPIEFTDETWAARRQELFDQLRAKEK